MKKLLFVSALGLAAAVSAAAQTPSSGPDGRPMEIVISDNMPKIKPQITAAPVATPAPVVVQSAPRDRWVSEPAPAVSEPLHGPSASQPVANTGSTAASQHALSFTQIKRLIADAKRQLQSKPITIASVESTSTSAPTDFVRIAFHNTRTRQVDFVMLQKDAFLSTVYDKTSVSESGLNVTVRTIRGNGVNTPIIITDSQGAVQQPLLVQYPVVREGRYMETAYYMSTHPGLVTPEVVGAGRLYVHNVIELARERLRDKGMTIQPQVADIAERLSTVEHVDHQRFRAELPNNIFNDIFTLYALNEGQTYRYSVSSAGAGGMVQMIPSTYRMVRSRYPQADLMPDFVEGMRNHVNAAKAMLLYMQWTWNDLTSSPAVNGALASGIATPAQLMAAGYNSNPARLAGYINRGGENWTGLIPRETKIYLQIYDALERNVPLKPRER
jgi:hypothetical protein